MEARALPVDEGGAGQPVEIAEAAATASEAPVTQAPAEYRVGSTWTNDVTMDGSTRRSTLTLVERREYRGREVYVLAWSEPQSMPGSACDGEDSLFVDAATEGWVGCLRDGAVLGRYSPHDFRLSWPLYVGKSWRVPNAWVDNVANTKSPLTVEWAVTAWEELTVPVGTFMAYRIERSDWPETVWYAPHLMGPVKGVSGGDGGDSGLIWELVARNLR